MSYQEDLQQQAFELEQKRHDNESDRGWLQVVSTYPIADHDANKKAVRDYCQPFPISLSGFKLMLANPRTASELDLVDDTRDMIREIIHLLRTNGKYTEIDLKNEEKRLGIEARQAGGREKIKSRLTSVREKQRLASMSVGAIKAELAANRPQPEAKVLPSHITAEHIKALPSPEIRKLIREYTATVINNRLFGRS